MVDIFVKGKKIGTYDVLSKKIIIKKDITKHIYKHIYSFCISEEVFEKFPMFDILEFETLTAFYRISRNEFCEFKTKFDAYINYFGDLQVALPIKILTQLDSESHCVIHKGSSAKEFYELCKDRYSNWEKRKKRI